MQRRGQRLVPHRQQHLNHTGNACCGFQVADVRLDRAQGAGALAQCHALLARQGTKGRSEGFDFERIAQFGPGAVGLDVAHRVDGHSRALPGVEHQLGLRLWIGCCERTRFATVSLGGGPDHAVDPIAVGLCARERLEQHDAHTLPLDIPVGRTVERLAAPVHRQHPQLRGKDIGVGRQDGADTAGHGELAFAVLQRLHRPVDRDERAGAGRIDRLTRTAKVEPVGHAVGQHGLRVAQSSLRARLSGIADKAHVLIRLRPGPYPDRARGQRRGADAGVFKRRPDMLQEHAVLRIHEHRLARRHAEKRGVEVADTRHEAAPARDGLVVFVRAAGVVLTPVPALGRYFAHTVVPGRKMRPQGIHIGGLRKTAADANDGDRL